ncbi:hypothetical protein THOM_1778 [Trachipleistophora hominis]|uniref:Uncharacterized protein n=1 Tax=Trachipleistophora hominis TaxID=72359 RepID=L7JW63_TRAHO|nr:hypothetical protein THOM_1778 [Trachipleistophora hominis]
MVFLNVKPMEDLEEKIRRKHQNDYLPQEVVDEYIRAAINHGLIVEEDLKQLPKQITFEGLKAKLDEFRHDNFFHGSFESVDDNVLYSVKENRYNTMDCNDTPHYINQIKNKTNNIMGKEQTMYHSFDNKCNLEKKEQRLKNVLNAYYEYEMMKMNRFRDEQRRKNRTNIIIGSSIAFGLFLTVLVLLLDFLEVNKPY